MEVVVETSSTSARIASSYSRLNAGTTSVIGLITRIVDVMGSAFDDTLIGNAQDNRLFGLIGNDTTHRWTRNDILFGGAGNDILNGGDGRDWLLGALVPIHCLAELATTY